MVDAVLIILSSVSVILMFAVRCGVTSKAGVYGCYLFASDDQVEAASRKYFRSVQHMTLIVSVFRVLRLGRSVESITEVTDF